MIKWNVYYYNINLKKMKVFNIFEHYGFREDIINATKQYDNKEEFLKYLKSSLMYYFWWKAEFEILLSPWLSSVDDDECLKIDIYDQVVNNWHIFSEYVWDNRNNLKE